MDRATPPPPPLITSALGLGLEAFVAVRASVAAGIADARAAFELILSAPSADWGFLVLSGVEPLVDALERLRPRADELEWLESTGAIDGPTRRRLAEARFACDLDAAPEGSVVFPGEAVVTVEGPFWQAQLVGGLVQAAITDATQVATRFARFSLASGGADIVEVGSATAHRLGGVPLLARAAFIGGARATTNALAARRYGIPVTGTQPVRFDVAVGSEDKAIRAWLAASPHGCVLRLDAARATVVLPRLVAAVRERVNLSGAAFDERKLAIEVPAGDRAGLARAIERAFATGGLAPPPVVVSGDVDEHLALELRGTSKAVRAYAVAAEAVPGTARLSRYELVAIEQGGSWSPRIRLANDAASSSDPGRKLLVRYSDASGCPVADVAHSMSERLQRATGGRFIDRSTGLGARLVASASAPLRSAAMRAGKRASTPEGTSSLRDRAAKAVQSLDEGHRRISSPSRYPVGVTQPLATLRTDLITRASEGAA
jgi:nicotinate phosphoribosyltransferase